MKSLKSLIITAGNFPYGGCTANFVRVFAKGLIENNVQADIILLKGNQDDFKHNEAVTAGFPGYRYFIFRILPSSFFMKLIQFILIITIFPWYLMFRILSGRYKVVYLYSIEYPYLTIPYLITCKILNIKCIRIITDIYSDKSVASTWWRRPKWYFYKIEFKYIDRFFDGLIVLSDVLKDKLIKSNVRPGKIIKILHFIDFKDFNLTNSATDTRKKSSYSIGYIGTISHLNGIDVLLDALRMLSPEMKEIRLILIGDLNYENGIADKIDLFKQETKMDLLAPGFQGPEKIREYYQACDILVNPRISSLSADAGFPTKVGEYMSTGKPVIVTAVGFFKDPEFRYQTGVIIIEPDSPAALAESIRRIINDYNSYLEKSRINLEWVRNNLDYYQNSKYVLDFIMNR